MYLSNDSLLKLTFVYGISEHAIRSKIDKSTNYKVKEVFCKEQREPLSTQFIIKGLIHDTHIMFSSFPNKL